MRTPGRAPCVRGPPGSCGQRTRRAHLEYRPYMATFEDLDAVARSLPEVEAVLSSAGTPEYKVRGKAFLHMRAPRKDAVDPDTGELMDDVLVFRTLGLAGKEEWLDDGSLPLFTTPHFNGWPAVLLRARDLGEVARDVLRHLIVDAWRAQAPKSLVKQLPEVKG